LSGQFFQQILFAAVGAILGAIVTSHAHRIVMSQPKYGQIIKLWINNTDCVFVLLVPLGKYDTA